MSNAAIDALLEATFTEALQAFHDETANGRRQPKLELEEYRKRRRDYQSWLRRESAAPEAISLAVRLAEQLPDSLSPEQHHELELATTRMLIRLYDAFINAAQGR